MKRIIFYLIVIFCGVAIVNLSRGVMDLLRVEDRVEQAEAEVGELREEKSELEDELAWRSTEAFVEQEIRNKLKLAKPDEVVVMVDEDLYLEEETEPAPEMEEDTPNWRKWWELFK